MFRSLALAAAIALVANVSAQDHPVGKLMVGNAYAFVTAPGQPNGAAYFTVVNHGGEPDRLVAASSPVAEAAEIHEATLENGIARMRKLDGIDVLPGQPIALAPGGPHVMLVGLKAPLAQGETLPLTLTFQTAGSITIDVPIEGLPQPAGHGAAGHDHGHEH